MTGSVLETQTLDEDFTREEFYAKFGEGSTFPQVICDDEKLEDALTRSNFSENNKSLNLNINKTTMTRRRKKFK